MVMATVYLAALAYLLECVHRAPYAPDLCDGASTNGYRRHIEPGPAD